MSAVASRLPCVKCTFPVAMYSFRTPSTSSLSQVSMEGCCVIAAARRLFLRGSVWWTMTLPSAWSCFARELPVARSALMSEPPRDATKGCGKVKVPVSRFQFTTSL